jgi:hypothetical protein
VFLHTTIIPAVFYLVFFLFHATSFEHRLDKHRIGKTQKYVGAHLDRMLGKRGIGFQFEVPINLINIDHVLQVHKHN